MSVAAPDEREAGQAGFTLVEVLVAFMIIALTLTLGMRVLADGSGWALRGPAAAARVEEAASLMNQLIADPQLSAGETGGVLPDGSRWAARVTDVTGLVPAKAAGRLIRIDLFLDKAAGRPLFTTLVGMTSR